MTRATNPFDQVHDGVTRPTGNPVVNDSSPTDSNTEAIEEIEGVRQVLLLLIQVDCVYFIQYS